MKEMKDQKGARLNNPHEDNSQLSSTLEFHVILSNLELLLDASVEQNPRTSRYMGHCLFLSFLMKTYGPCIPLFSSKSWMNWSNCRLAIFVDKPEQKTTGPNKQRRGENKGSSHFGGLEKNGRQSKTVLLTIFCPGAFPASVAVEQGHRLFVFLSSWCETCRTCCLSD